jgi:hypothetical protein
MHYIQYTWRTGSKQAAPALIVDTYYKEMRNHYIKSLLLIFTFALGILFPFSEWVSYPALFIGIMLSFLTGLSIPFVLLLNLGMGTYNIQPPKWTDEINNMKNPLIFVRFTEYFAYSWGLGLMIGGLILHQTANTFGICLLAAGLGMKSGIFLLLKTHGLNRG